MGVYCSTESSVDTLPAVATAQKSDIEHRERHNKSRADWIRAFEDENVHPHDKQDLLQTLVDQYDDMDVVETVFDDGDRALHKAVQAGNIDLAFALISSCGAIIDAPAVNTGATPLILAATNADIPMIQMLLGQHEDYELDGTAPARIKYTDSSGVSAADIAAQSTDEAMWALLCPNKLVANTLRRNSLSIAKGEKKTVSSPPPLRKTSDSDGIIEIPAMETEENPAVIRAVEEVVEAKTATADEIRAFPAWKGGFVEKKKKQDFLGASWQRRYLVLKGDVIGWATNEIVMEAEQDVDRKKFNSYEELNKIDRVEAEDSDDQRSFILHVINSTKRHQPREYHFKAESTEERDEWVRIIKHAVEGLEAEVPVPEAEVRQTTPRT